MSDRGQLELHLFDEVADAVRSLVPAELGTIRCRPHRYGIKVWIDVARPPREHYEAQVLGPSACDEATVLALEVGFHAEHPDPARNQAVLDQLLATEDRWRPTLGPAGGSLRLFLVLGAYGLASAVGAVGRSRPERSGHGLRDRRPTDRLPGGAGALSPGGGRPVPS